MKLHGSALKHGLDPEDIIHAAYWAQWIEPLEDDDWPHQELRLGFDTKSRLLETVVLVFESGSELVIHAMPARKQYWDLLP
ncbi:MAG: toxin [Propionibacteriaceae bacterium]|nr:toxin [Propionibacteriaceae bacterium]